MLDHRAWRPFHKIAHSKPAQGPLQAAPIVVASPCPMPFPDIDDNAIGKHRAQGLALWVLPRFLKLAMAKVSWGKGVVRTRKLMTMCRRRFKLESVLARDDVA